MRILREVQRALESLYRLDAALDVADFLITHEARTALGVSRLPREQLLLVQEQDGLSLGLFVDDAVLERLEDGLGATGGTPAPHAAWMDPDLLGEFLLVIEGVSHFLYVSQRAHERRCFSALELELQAEVDKYLLLLLAAWQTHGRPPADLRERLFARVSYCAELSAEERDRYRTANAAAGGYAASLESRFVRRRAIPDLLNEVRRFYRLDCSGKLDHIVRRAA